MFEDAYGEARRALQAARASVFCLDVTDADSHTLEAGLQMTAEDTGGFFARTHLFTEQAMQRLAGALAGHYVLFVEATAPSDKRWHAIEVELVGRRAGSSRSATISARLDRRPLERWPSALSVPLDLRFTRRSIASPAFAPLGATGVGKPTRLACIGGLSRQRGPVHWSHTAHEETRSSTPAPGRGRRRSGVGPAAPPRRRPRRQPAAQGLDDAVPGAAVPARSSPSTSCRPSRKRIAQQRKEIDAIVNNPQPPTFANTIEALENAGELLSKVQGVFGALQGAETNAELQAVNREVTPLLSARCATRSG